MANNVTFFRIYCLLSWYVLDVVVVDVVVVVVVVVVLLYLLCCSRSFFLSFM